jgi:putative restriction endonuclease
VRDEAMRVSEAEYLRLAAEQPDEKWDLDCGVLRRKPPMTWGHNWAARRLHRDLLDQLGRDEFDVVIDQARVRGSASRYYIPDLFVVPMRLVRQGLMEHRHELEAYREPVPLVVEVWSPPTGNYDVDPEVPQYKQRGDLEIWRIHPYERTLVTWRLQADGSYTETLFTEGSIQPIALPNVTIT